MSRGGSSTFSTSVESFYLNDTKLNLLIALIATSSSIFYLPSYYFLVSTLFLLMGYFISNTKMKKYITVIFAVSSLVFIINDYSTLLDIEAAVSFLIILQSLKYLEIQGQRDSFGHYYILLLSLVGITLFEQNLFSTIMAVFSLFLILYGLIKVEDPHVAIKSMASLNFKKSVMYALIALPISLALFIFFPRFEIGFRTFNPNLAQSGFSPDASPGQVNQLVLSNQTVFRASFDKNYQIPISQMYWVGNILVKTNGYDWLERSQTYFPSQTPRNFDQDSIVDYEIKSETMTNEYLFTLDAPVKYPAVMEGMRKLRDKTFKLNRVYTKKIRYRGSSVLGLRSTQVLSLKEKDAYLELPAARISQQVKDLVSNLKGNSNHETVSNILNYFRNEGFVYTLRPGVTTKLDQFLFQTKRGFCTHYASAFSILLRVAGIPARLVSGFQGGKWNDVGNFYSITGRDAHAWSEYFDEEEGWLRVDPVQAIQPQRIEIGGSEFFELLPDGEGSVNLNNLNEYRNSLWTKVTLYIENLNNMWGNFMYSFNQEYQLELARKLNLSIRTFYSLAFIVPVLIALVYFAFYLYRRRIKTAHLLPIEKDYLILIKRLHKLDIRKEPQDGPRTLREKVIHSSLDHELKKKYVDFINRYLKEIYKV